MKKSLFMIALLCFSVSLFAQENAVENEQETIKGIHPYKTEENEKFKEELAHWSIIPHVGFNIFDGDFKSEMKHNVSFPTVGLGVEYNFTPVWSLGVEYLFDMYQVTGKNDDSHANADKLLKGYMHKADLYASMDIINLCFPRAKRKIFTLQPLVGAGYMWYRNSIMYPDYTRRHTADYDPEKMDKYEGVFFIKAGVNFEFNLNRTLALGIRATYDYAMNDYVDSRGYATEAALASKNNDGIFDFTLNLRCKIEAVKKTHVRNVSSLERMDKMLAQPARDTIIIERYDSIIVRETTFHTETEKPEQVFYVYYDTNKSDLNDEGLVTVQQVADRVVEDSTLYLVVTGYADNTGSDKLNYKLGDKRAENVISELSREYGIPVDHMYSTGLGKIQGKYSKGKYAPNRRTDIRIVDKATFERMKNNLEDKRAEREVIENMKTLPLSETQRKEKINTYKNRPSEQIISDRTTTLSKLARKYYDNVFCWVYIYLANKDAIKNPNTIFPGTHISIPELTEEETKTTKEECLSLYGLTRGK